MFKALRKLRHKRRARKSAAVHLRTYQAQFPGIPWEPFFELREYFSGKELSALNEQAFLYRLALAAPEQATVIEIGSWIGLGTCILGIGLRGKRAKLYAVDCFDMKNGPVNNDTVYQPILKKISPHLSQREMFDLNLRHFGLEDTVEAVVSDSESAIGLLPLKNESVDLLFIDGGHDLATVRRDIELYVPLVKPGGVVAFHDFHSGCDVPTAVWEAIKRQSFRDFVGIYHTLVAFGK
jgi:predicted O-methyltransferase YrrM